MLKRKIQEHVYGEESKDIAYHDGRSYEEKS
jgi:hypothetical protein